MTNSELMALDRQVVMQTYGRFPVTIARGEGAYFWDLEGRRYVDFTSGIGVNSLGSCHPAWIAAIEAQIHSFGHTSNLFYTEPCVRRAAAGADSCAVMLELIQGEGGVRPLDGDFVRAVAAFCREKDLLLLVDEVQTGVGRTGSLFAFQQYGILPDVCSFAKGIAGGLPMSGILANEKCRQVLTPGTHATTFGGNPVCAAAALAVLDTLDTAALNQVTDKGFYLREQIAALGSPYVRDVRGMGLMVGVGIQGMTHAEAAAKLREAGLLCLTAGSDTLRLLPPLTITKAELDEGLAIMKKVLCD